jgi:TRAP-type C4-dicarboxylate transport system substrate-binding protein
MKKFKCVLTGLMSMALIFSVAGCGSSATSSGNGTEGGGSQPVTLKLSYAPSAGSFYGQGYTEFAKYVEEESGGQVKISLFPAGSLVSDQQALDTVMQGNVDLVHVMVPYASPTIKELTPFEVPGAYSGERWEELEAQTHSILDKIFAKYKIHYVGSNDTNVVTFVADKKIGKAIQTPADMKGFTVRTPGKWGGDAITLWGGSPVTVPLGDLPNALQLGTVNASYVGWVITGPNKLYEIAPNITVTSLQENFGMLLMAEASWQKLNAEQQVAFNKAADRWMAFNHQLSQTMRKEFIDTVNGTAGCTLVILTDEQNKAFTNVVTDQLLEQAAAIAGTEGEELIQVFAGLR